MRQFAGNAFTRAFALDVPIVQGPMGGVAGPELVAAVANAGGLGVLPIWPQPPDRARDDIEQTRKLTRRPFAVNLRADLVQLDHLRIALDGGVPIVHLFWGDPSPSMAPIREADARMICTVGDAETARAAMDAGAQALIAQGVEAGGHVQSETPLRHLLDAVLAVAGRAPVIAAGGLVGAEDVARVVRAGAAGALLGTRFVATMESLAHDDYKQALIEAGADATVRSECFDDGWPQAPHRHLKNETFGTWQRAGRPPPGTRPGEGDVVLRMGEDVLERYAVVPPLRGMTGDVRNAAMYAGTGVASIGECLPAARVVEQLASLL